MSNEIGGFLNISQKDLKIFEDMDKKLENIETHSKTAAEALKSGFSSINLTASTLSTTIAALAKQIEKLNTAGIAMRTIGESAQGSAKGVSAMNESLSRAAQILNQLSGRPNQSTFGTWNIAGLKEGISDLKKFVENTKTLSKVEQQKAVEAMRYMKMELDYQRKSEEQKTQSAIKESQKRIDQIRKERAEESKRRERITSQWYSSSASRALGFSSNTKSLGDEVKAIEYLKKARLSLNTTTEEGRRQLNAINAAIAQHSRALQQAGVQSQSLARNHRNLWDVSGQLQRQLALLFSVSQIEGYINKVVQVRGQFELQQVALRAIVQDKDKADRIFSQTMQQALKSPFQAMQLVTFTKQLAAYRIESDKLFDTTKRLADVSAGLGVDMQRLILAYGQVKAAAYLRGTEVRQFTEAGINLYGELQSYFEEVKGEAYTTAQIVDMISKRMVKFEDVEAVFQRMTDKGGLFFNMQEVQVNTLHGQINRLKDVISLMMNEIGKSNQEGFMSISTAIDLINGLLENWRMVASVLETVLWSYAAIKSTSALMWAAERINIAWNNKEKAKSITLEKVWNTLKWKNVMATRAKTAATEGATTAQNGLNMAVAKNPYGAILTVIVAVGVAIKEVVQNTNRLKKALDGIAAEGAFSVVQSSNNYAQLASVVTDSTKSYQEHNKALAELKKKYSDILPEQYLNAEGIKALNGNYSEAIKQIHQYINAKTKERMIDEVGQDANKDMYSNQQKTAKAISEIIEEQHGMKVSWSEISGVLSQVQEKLLSGAIKSTQQLREETEKVVEQYTGLGNIDLSDYFTQLSGSSFGGANKFRFDTIQIERSQFRDWFESARSYISQVESIEQRFSKGSISMTAQRYQEQKDATEKMVANAMNAYDVLRDSQKKNTKVTKDELEHARSLVQKVLKAIGSDVQVDSAYINKLFNDSFFFEEEKQKATQTKLKQLFDKLTEEAKESGDTSGAVWLQEFEKQINGLNLNPLQNSIKKFLLGISGNADIQANWNIRSGETEAEFKKRIKTEIDTRNEIIRKSQSTIYPEYGQDTSKVKSELEELVRLYDELGGDKKKGGSKAERDIWAERISVLKEMQARYEKLNDLMGENRAIAETRTAFEGALRFTRMGEVIKAEDIIPTKQGMIDALEKLLAAIPNDVKNAAKKTGLEKEIAELKIGIQQDYLKEQLDKTKQNIEDMFSGLDLHQKLKDAGLSEAEVQALFPGLAKTWDEVGKGIEESFAKNFPKGEYKIEGTTANEQYKAEQEKLNQQRIKESQNLVIELTKAYKTQLTEQMQLDTWYVKERSKIYAKAYDEESKTFKDVLTPQMQKDYEANLKSEYEKRTSENTWKDFQATDSYIAMFENMDKMSGDAIQRMIERLDNLRSSLKGLPADQVRTIVSQMEKLRDEQIERNPFKAFVDGIRELKTARESLVELNKQGEATDVIISKEEAQRLHEAAEDAKTAADAKAQKDNLALQELERQREELYKYTLPENKETDDYKAQLASLDGKIEAQREVVNLSITEAELQGKISKEYAEQIRNVDNAAEKLEKGAITSLNTIADTSSSLSSAITDIASNLENVFGTMSAEAKDAIDSTSEVLGGIGNMAGSIARAVANPMDIGAYIGALQGLVQTISSLFAIGDKAKEREIQQHRDNVENLQKSYEDLKVAMDNAWSISGLQESYDAAVRNLDERIASYQAMIEAERGKKKSDEDELKKLKEEQDALRKEREELNNQRLAEVGGINENEYKSAAQSFVDAWMDAYMETGDGLEALQGEFEDFFINVLKKQAMMKIAEKFLDPIFTELEGALSDNELDRGEVDRFRSMVEETAPEFNEALKAFMESLGVFGGQGKAELSALTQSIQGITESTAEALESLLNSVRFFVAQQTTDISAIRGLLAARQELESSNADNNPMLVELREQTNYLNIISDRIDRVFTTSNIKGAGLRVYLQN